MGRTIGIGSANVQPGFCTSTVEKIVSSCHTLLLLSLVAGNSLLHLMCHERVSDNPVLTSDFTSTWLMTHRPRLESHYTRTIILEQSLCLLCLLITQLHPSCPLLVCLSLGKAGQWIQKCMLTQPLFLHSRINLNLFKTISYFSIVCGSCRPIILACLFFPSIVV